jgi:hypothetical protein
LYGCLFSPSELNDIDSEDEDLSNNELDSDEGQLLINNLLSLNSVANLDPRFFRPVCLSRSGSYKKRETKLNLATTCFLLLTNSEVSLIKVETLG